MGDGGAPLLLLLLVVRWEGSSVAGGLMIEWPDRLEDLPLLRKTSHKRRRE